MDFYMNLIRSIFILFYIFQCECLEPVSSTFGVYAGAFIVSASFASYKYLKCTVGECCNENWKIFNATAFDESLQKNFYGQHLAKLVITKSLVGHFRRRRPEKALVMSFHGWTGSGKNYVSKIIVDHLYKSKSKFVHWYIATTDFPHKDDVKSYIDRLQNDIPKFTAECGNSIFIFDEVDKMPSGVIDALKPYLDHHEEVGGIDYRNNIFIFLSNAGGSDITKVAFNFWLDAKEREDITMKDIEPLINNGAFNERGGFYRSDIVASNLIDVYIPFLPLEKKHVKKCIETEINQRGGIAVKEETLNRIASQLTYDPPEFEVFSSSGCKKVTQKIDIYGDDDEDIIWTK